MTPRRIHQLATRRAKLIEQARDKYADADLILERIVAATGGATAVDHEGQTVTVNDRLAGGKLKAFTATSFNRYEVKIEPTRSTAGAPEASET